MAFTPGLDRKLTKTDGSAGNRLDAGQGAERCNPPASRRENSMRTCRTSAVGGLKLSFLPIWVVIGAILFGIGRSRRVVPGPGSGKSCNRFSRVLAYGVAMAFGTIDSASKVAKAADWPALAVFTPRTGGGA
jgi:hypothetical protein